MNTRFSLELWKPRDGSYLLVARQNIQQSTLSSARWTHNCCQLFGAEATADLLENILFICENEYISVNHVRIVEIMWHVDADWVGTLLYKFFRIILRKLRSRRISSGSNNRKHFNLYVPQCAAQCWIVFIKCAHKTRLPNAHWSIAATLISKCICVSNNGIVQATTVNNKRKHCFCLIWWTLIFCCVATAGALSFFVWTYRMNTHWNDCSIGHYTNATKSSTIDIFSW